MQALRTERTTDDRQWTTVHFHPSCVVYLFGANKPGYTVKFFQWSVVCRLWS